MIVNDFIWLFQLKSIEYNWIRILMESIKNVLKVTILDFLWSSKIEKINSVVPGSVKYIYDTSLRRGGIGIFGNWILQNKPGLEISQI